MSTQTDRIKQAINCGRVLRDTFGGNVGGGPDVFAEALAALSELEAQPSQTKDLEAFFERLRFDKTRHIGLGDIRLTIADQDELLSLTRSVAQPSAPTVDQIADVRDSILRLMGYGVDMPNVEEIIIDLAKPPRT